MNTKIIFAILAIQIAAGAVIDSDKVKGLVKDIEDKVDDFQKNVIGKYQDQINSTFGNLIQQAEQIGTKIEAEIKEKVAGLGALPEDISACIQAEKPNITAIGDAAKSAMQGLIVKEGINVLPLVGKVNSTINEAKELVANSNQQMEACKGKPFLEAAKCIFEVGKTVAEGSVAITKEIVAEEQQAATLFPKVISDVSTTGSTIIQNAITKGQAIMEEAVQCVKNSIKN